MAGIHLSAVFGILFFLFCKDHFPQAKTQKIKSGRLPVLLFFSAALLFRIIAAILSKGFDTDTACFAAWSERVYSTGFSGFYSPDVFTDYPPGYIYLLYPIGALRNLLSIPYYSSLHLLLLRFPAILCDLLSGVAIFRLAQKKWKDTLLPYLFAAAYLFNPAVLLNAAVWGQVDSIYTFLLILTCLFLCEGKTIPSYFLFFIGILIKPQMIIFAPVLFIGFLQHVVLQKFTWQKLLWNVFAGLSAILLDLLLILPFGLGTVLSQYLGTVTSYPYAAVNACNFWGLLGQNWISQDTAFLGISYAVYGYIGIAVFVILTLIYAFRNKQNRTMYPLLCSLLMSGIFVFSVRMHERYLYPAVILLLFACIFQPSKELFLAYCGFSIFHFYNTAFVLYCYDPNNYDRRSPFLLLVSAGTMVCLGYLLYLLFHAKLSENLFLAMPASKQSKANGDKHLPSFSPSKQLAKLTLIDAALLLAITGLYAAFAFRDLGDRQAPESSLSLTRGEEIVLQFSSDTIPAKLTYFTALPNDVVFQCYANNTEETDWLYLGTLNLANVFTWQTTDLPADSVSLPVSFLTADTLTYRFIPDNDKVSLLELVFLDSQDNVITCQNEADYPALFDERSMVPERANFRNSMYFDEIYHARTAYEFINGEVTYENTHPPLGKILIALGVKLFGMNPFGWRFIGTLFGVLMVPLIYLFGKELFSSTPLAALAAFLYAFDFMHFTQTRIATIDVYITFFVILMYLFMYRYCKLSYYDRPLYRTFLPLGACGIAMGLGVASKWTGVYAGMGLALIFFLRLYQSYSEAHNRLMVQTSGRKKQSSWETTFSKKCAKTILFCIVFFVIIPGIIYLLSYIPFRDYTNDGLLGRMLRNQRSMLSYHSNLNATHPYSSAWHEWPTMIRPTWYYSSIVNGVSGLGGLREGISAFGNPLVWWVGIPAVLYMFYLAYKKKDRTAIFLLIGYFAQYLPWFLVTRITFIYHYFPSVAFVVFMIVYSIKTIRNQVSRKLFFGLIILYALATFVLFLLFYPVLAGQPIEADYVVEHLRWLKDWVLVAR